MTQYRITQTEYTDPYGEHYSCYHLFDVGTLVEVKDNHPETPSVEAIDGPDIGTYQYVPYACMEAV